MNAKEFIQKFGWNDARVCILNCACPEDRWFMRHGNLVSDQDFDDLKRLVESHELIGNFGGIKRAKRILKKSYMSFSTMVSVAWNDKPFQCTLEQLEQAIADVESCMEVK